MSFQNCTITGVNVDSEEYHAKRNAIPRGNPEFIMSPSQMGLFAKQPRKWRRGYKPKDTEAKAWGNLIDCRALTPQFFDSRYIVEPVTYDVSTLKCPACNSIADAKKCRSCGEERKPFTVTKEWNYQSKECSKWYEEQVAAHKIPVSKRSVQQCDDAVASLLEPINGDDTIQRWFNACERQVLIEGEWKDEATGLIIPVSALLDFVPHLDSEFASSLGDFKSAISADKYAFERQAFKFGYQRQAAFDMDLFAAATGQERNTWCFIISENYEPWEPNRAFYGEEGDMGSPSFLQIGREEQFGGYKRILADYCQCLKHDKWPGYSQNDEAVDGWCVLRPRPFQAEQLQFSPRYEFGDEKDDALGVEYTPEDFQH